MFNILLTSAGRRVELVRSFRQAHYRLGLPGQIVATDVDWLAPALREVDEPQLVCRFDDAKYLSQLVTICREHEIAAVFPLNDGELRLLARQRGTIEATGARVAVVDPAVADICHDKWNTHQFFRRIGLPTPRSWLPDGAPRDPPAFPLFIKPRLGSAGESTFRLDNQVAYEFFVDYVRQPIVQEFLSGPEITSDVVCGLDGRVMSIVSRRRIAVRGGEAMKSVTMHDDRIEQACREIARELPARGPITVQCMLKDGIPHFVEINARLGGGVPLAMAAGVDVPALLLADIAGLPLDGIDRQPRLGLYMTRCDESFFLTEDVHEEFAGHRVRSR